MKVGIILQARMGSSRLPGKILKKIGSKTLLEHILFRLTFLKYDAKFIIATTINSKDDVVERFCKINNVECFRGSEKDVLERYYLCAIKYGFDHIIRMTGDNPFTDIGEVDRLIDLHLNTKADYSHSFGVLPVGVGAEIFNIKALESSYLKGTKENHREHVNEYIQENPELFKIQVLNVPEDKNKPDIRLTVDTENDYLKACYIINNSDQEYITTQEAIRLCLQYA